MFCMGYLRCSSEGPSLRRDPAKAVGRLPQLPPWRQLAPKARSGAGSRACAATRSGAAGVAGGNRTDLGDQSSEGLVLSRADRRCTACSIVIAGSSGPAGPGNLDHPAQHLPPPFPATFAFPQEGYVVRNENEAAIGFLGAAGHCPCFDSRRSGPSALRQGHEGLRGCIPGTEWRGGGVDRHGSGTHADDRFPRRAKQTESDWARASLA